MNSADGKKLFTIAEFKTLEKAKEFLKKNSGCHCLYTYWEYNDGEFIFDGVSKFYNGFNKAIASSRKSFRDFFHKKYPGRPFTDMKAINLEAFNIVKVEIKSKFPLGE